MWLLSELWTGGKLNYYEYELCSYSPLWCEITFSHYCITIFRLGNILIEENEEARGIRQLSFFSHLEPTSPPSVSLFPPHLHLKHNLNSKQYQWEKPLCSIFTFCFSLPSSHRFVPIFHVHGDAQGLDIPTTPIPCWLFLLTLKFPSAPWVLWRSCLFCLVETTLYCRNYFFKCSYFSWPF